MKALVIGATGATGEALVTQLLEDEDFTEISVFVRQPLILTHPKLTVHQVDFTKPNLWQHLVVGNIAFSALGTTLKNAGSEAAQWQVDYHYQYQFANAAHNNAIPTFILVSAINANPVAKLFYPRMKGELEEAIKRLGFNQLVILRPGLLQRPNSDRLGEKLLCSLFSLLSLLPILKTLTPLKTADLATVMRILSKHSSARITRVPPKQIQQILRQQQNKQD